MRTLLFLLLSGLAAASPTAIAGDITLSLDRTATTVAVGDFTVSVGSDSVGAPTYQDMVLTRRTDADSIELQRRALDSTYSWDFARNQPGCGE